MDTLPDFKYLRPSSIAEAAQMFGSYAGSRFIAGGTDLIANIRRGLASPGALIDITDIRDIARIHLDSGQLVIGAGVTLTDLADDERVVADFPVIAAAASTVAGPTHRNVATVGGNLCQDTRCVYYNQSQWWRDSNDGCLKYEGSICHVAPGGDRCWAAFCGDLAPALLVMAAEVEVVSADRTHRMALSELYRDDGLDHLNLGEQEFISAVRIPVGRNIRADYAKSRLRGSIDFPLVGVAVALRRDGDVLDHLSVALTGTNCSPLAVPEVMELTGKSLDDRALEKLGRIVKARIQPMNSTFTSHQYRRRVAITLAKRLARQLFKG
ncbi:MAG: 4-hydroxybenzoyl-CoA reductase subunit beta [Pseudomonadota bacterium]|nr:4-hydroxybenzoyl-CoA reductase subunit beta [Pseudomonadota bacterium]